MLQQLCAAGSRCKNAWPGQPFVPTFRGPGAKAVASVARVLEADAKPLAGCGAPAYGGLHSGKLLLHLEAKARWCRMVSHYHAGAALMQLL